MKCSFCNNELNESDKFCPKCGHCTVNGYKFYHDEENINKVIKGPIYKQKRYFFTLAYVCTFIFMIFGLFIILLKDDFFKPYVYLKKNILEYVYGHNSSILNNNNKYFKTSVNNKMEAIKYIEDDFNKQTWLCNHDIDTYLMEYNLQNDFNIPSVSFCDMKYKYIKEIDKVIRRMYVLFPNIKGALTNISISNVSNPKDYIASFQAMYQFVNPGESIEQFNKVNKTQILLNSYYFLNPKILDSEITKYVPDNWYVKNVSWYSLIAHEMGHYISFMLILKKYDLENIIFETKENTDIIKKVIDEYNSGLLSKSIVKEALDNYNLENRTDIDEISYARAISNYAATKDKNNMLIYDEIIAEAVHDYYLNEKGMSNASAKIIEIIIERLKN